MEITLLLEFEERQQLRDWLQENHASSRECWVVMSRAKNPVGVLPYLNVVEEALDGLTVLLRSCLTEDLHNDYPLEERTATGPSLTRRGAGNWKAEV